MPPRYLFSEGIKGAPARYTLAIVVTAAALLLRKLIAPLYPYQTLWIAVIFSAWYCGPGPAIVCVISGLLGVMYFFLPVLPSFHGPGSAQLWGMLGFSVLSAVLIALTEGNRRSRRQLLRNRADLERNVEARLAELQQKNTQIVNQANTLELVNDGLRDLSARLLRVQDEERRHIARELHDSTGQMLTALTMKLTLLGNQLNEGSNPTAARSVSETLDLATQVSADLRTMSYLLHPPLLDELGLAAALRWYIDGFRERSNIEVSLELPSHLERLPSDIETAIFRTVQEGLTNIHRHAGTRRATIRLTRRNGEVVLEIRSRQGHTGGTARRHRVGRSAWCWSARNKGAHQRVRRTTRYPIRRAGHVAQGDA